MRNLRVFGSLARGTGHPSDVDLLVDLHLSPETRARAPQVPWKDVAGLRDLIAHEYFRIEMRRVLDIVRRDLPRLEAAVDRLLAGAGV